MAAEGNGTAAEPPAEKAEAPVTAAAPPAADVAAPLTAAAPAAADVAAPPANGGASANGKVEIEETNAPDYTRLDYAKGNAWEMDMSKVMCINMLASGAFGKVFYGMYNKEDVAVKLMNLPPTMTPSEVKGLQNSFRQEIAVWHKLKHPNVVQFVGASLDARNIVASADELPPPGQPVWAIVTEFMAGGTLRGFLAKRKRLGLKDVLRFALDVARGLEYLHSHDIVHRDLKSDNLLMDQRNVVKIADFGVARTEAKNPVDMTCETGTVRWMAPEVIEHKPYTRKVDVYSFGIVLWELCTCELPFKDLSFVQLAYNVVNKDVRPTIPDTVHPELAALMRECWAKDSEKRPDFSNIVKRLEALQEAEGGAGTPGEGAGGKGDGQGCSCAIL